MRRVLIPTAVMLGYLAGIGQQQAIVQPSARAANPVALEQRISGSASRLQESDKAFHSSLLEKMRAFEEQKGFPPYGNLPLLDSNGQPLLDTNEYWEELGRILHQDLIKMTQWYGIKDLFSGLVLTYKVDNEIVVREILKDGSRTFVFYPNGAMLKIMEDEKSTKSYTKFKIKYDNEKRLIEEQKLVESEMLSAFVPGMEHYDIEKILQRTKQLRRLLVYNVNFMRVEVGGGIRGTVENQTRDTGGRYTYISEMVKGLVQGLFRRYNIPNDILSTDFSIYNILVYSKPQRLVAIRYMTAPRFIYGNYLDSILFYQELTVSIPLHGNDSKASLVTVANFGRKTIREKTLTLAPEKFK